MGFSQELNDFSEGFSSGMKMVDSRSDRELKKLEAEEKRQRLRRGEIELDPEFLRLEREGKEATIAGQKSQAEVDRQAAIAAERKNTPEYRALEDAQMAAETAAQEATTRYNTALAVAKEYENTPQAREAAEAAAAAKLELDKATAEGYRLDSARKAWLLEPEQKQIETDAAREKIDSSRATTEGVREDTRGKRLDNDGKQRFQDILKEKTQGIKKRLGGYLGGENVPEPEYQQGDEAVPAGSGFTPPETGAGTTPGPQSAVEVPGDTMSTTEAPDPDAGEGEPVEAARPLESEAEAVPTEAGPAPEARRVSAREAGPRAHPHVDEQQSRTAATRKQPLAAETVNVLEYAGDKTGIRAVVYSGGQAGKGEEGPRTGSTRHDHGLAADVRLYDVETGRMLDMSNPKDAQRMHDFGMYAVQAGATGIGAGEGYMGNHSMHIGFGNEATWGGASWIADAHAKGKATRGDATAMPGNIEDELPEMFQSGSIHKSAKDAALAGMKYAIGSYGLDQDSAVDSPEQERAGAAYQSGEFGAEPEQVEEVERIVQETAREAGGELSEAETPMYALAALYEAYLGVGDTEGAQKAAAAMMGHYKKLFSQYGAVAKAAASQGDIDGAVEAAAKAYANVPDGMDVEFNQLEDGSYEVVMTNQETGEITNRQIATPQEIGGLIMEVNPGHFEQLMADAAGIESKGISSAAAEAISGELGISAEQAMQMTEGEIEELRLAKNANKPKTSTGKKSGPSPAEQNEIVEGVDNAFTSFANNALAGGAEDTAGKLAADSDLMMNIKPIAEQIAIDNFGTLRPALAVSAVVNMVNQEPVAAKALEDGRISVKMEGVPEFTMDSELYHRLAVTRANMAAPEPAGTSQAEYNQTLGGLRRTTPPGVLPDYDPTRYPIGERVGGTAVPTAVPPSIYASRAPAVFDPNATYPPWEAIKSGLGSLMAVPEGPGYNMGGRAGAGPVRRFREDRETREREEYAKPKVGKPRSGAGGGGRGAQKLRPRI